MADVYPIKTSIPTPFTPPRSSQNGHARAGSREGDNENVLRDVDGVNEEEDVEIESAGGEADGQESWIGVGIGSSCRSSPLSPTNPISGIPFPTSSPSSSSIPLSVLSSSSSSKPITKSKAPRPHPLNRPHSHPHPHPVHHNHHHHSHYEPSFHHRKFPIRQQSLQSQSASTSQSRSRSRSRSNDVHSANDEDDSGKETIESSDLMDSMEGLGKEGQGQEEWISHLNPSSSPTQLHREKNERTSSRSRWRNHLISAPSGSPYHTQHHRTSRKADVDHSRSRASSTISSMFDVDGRDLSVLGSDKKFGRKRQNGNSGSNIGNGNERERDRDRAYMRFVPGLGLRSGVMTFDDDEDEEDEPLEDGETETGEDEDKVKGISPLRNGWINPNINGGRIRTTSRPRPRSSSLIEVPSMSSLSLSPPNFSSLKPIIPNPSTNAETSTSTSTIHTPATLTPAAILGAPPSFLPHFSLDSKFSLPPGLSTTLNNPATISRPPLGNEKKSSFSAKHKGGKEEIHLDLGLGRALDHTIEEAVKRVKAESIAKSQGIPAAEMEGMLSNPNQNPTCNLPEAITGLGGIKEEMCNTKEVPLPPEAARVLNEARANRERELFAAVKGLGPKNGRKASMGMGLFKESASAATADASVIGREGRDRERERRGTIVAPLGSAPLGSGGESSALTSPLSEFPLTMRQRQKSVLSVKPGLSRTTTRSLSSPAVQSQSEDEEDFFGKQIASASGKDEEETGLQMGIGRRGRSHYRSKTAPGDPTELLLQRQISGSAVEMTPAALSRSGSPVLRERTASAPLGTSTQLYHGRKSRPSSVIASPAISRMQSRRSSLKLQQPEAEILPPKPLVFPRPEVPLETALGWSSEDTWEDSSSGLSSTEGETSDEDEEGADEGEDGFDVDKIEDLEEDLDQSWHKGDQSGFSVDGSLGDSTSRLGPYKSVTTADEPGSGPGTAVGSFDANRYGGSFGSIRGSPAMRGDASPRLTIPLQPFNNKVGGHSEIYKFTRRAVCKVSRNLLSSLVSD